MADPTLVRDPYATPEITDGCLYFEATPRMASSSRHTPLGSPARPPQRWSRRLLAPSGNSSAIPSGTQSPSSLLPRRRFLVHVGSRKNSPTAAPKGGPRPFLSSLLVRTGAAAPRALRYSVGATPRPTQTLASEKQAGSHGMTRDASKNRGYVRGALCSRAAFLQIKTR